MWISNFEFMYLTIVTDLFSQNTDLAWEFLKLNVNVNFIGPTFTLHYYHKKPGFKNLTMLRFNQFRKQFPQALSGKWSGTCVRYLFLLLRIDPEISLAGIRHEISRQVFFNGAFTFLRHVGRALVVVSKKQETEMKGKHYLPPHSTTYEILLLPGAGILLLSKFNGKSLFSEHSSSKCEFHRNITRI